MISDLKKNHFEQINYHCRAHLLGHLRVLQVVKHLVLVNLNPVNWADKTFLP